MINTSYRERIFQLAANDQNIASRRLLHILDHINFDEIKIIADIGAWHAKQSVELAVAFPNATVYSFEPNPETFDECLNNISNQPKQIRDRIKLIKLALSDINGIVNFYPLDTSKTSSSNKGIASLSKLRQDKNGSFLGDFWVQKEIQVESMTAKKFFETFNIKGFDLVWMDVQGAELKVLKGFEETLANTKAILTEVGIIPYYDTHCLKSDMDYFMGASGFLELKEAYKEVSWACGDANEADVIYVVNSNKG